jgi:hypothetical protein
MPVSASPIEILGETVLTMGQAAKLFPSSRKAKCLHVTTLTRWCMKGKRFNGHLIKLEAAFLPGGLRTSREAINRFMLKLASIRDPANDPVNLIVSPTQQQKLTAAQAKRLADDQAWLKENLRST